MQTVTITGIEDLRRNMQGYLNEVATKRERQKVLLAGGRVLRNKARAKIPRHKKAYTYQKGGKRIVIKHNPLYYYTKSGGKVVSYPGNLKKSMYAFRKKDGDVAVGPRVLRKIGSGELGKTSKTSSGWYASMLYKKAANFRRQVTESALASNLSAIDLAMQAAYKRIHQYWAKRHNL
jgi:hypothetical protein